jgi:competence protein ComEC
MRTGSVLFLVGVLAATCCRGLPPLPLVFLLPLCLWLISTRSGWRWPAWLAAGFLWTLLRAAIALSPGFDAALEGQTVQVEGTVASLPVHRDGLLRFDFRVRRLQHGGADGPVPGIVRLNWYRGGAEIVPGDHWLLAVRLKRPFGFMNPGGHDYEGSLFQQRIKATGYVVDASGNRKLKDGGRRTLLEFRFWMRQRLEQNLSGHSHAGLVLGLALGDRSRMTAEHWRVLTATGTNHLLAISGLHIGLAAAIGYFAGRWAWILLPGAALRLPAPRAGALSGLLAAGAYAAMAGFSVPTQRALLMTAIAVLMLCFRRRCSFSQGLAAALLAVLVFDPFAVLAAGFWLSFAAVAVIGWGVAGRTGPLPLWRRWGRVQIIIAVGLLPALILWFQQVPVLGVFANLVAVPWVSLLTVPLVLAGSAAAAAGPGAAAWLLHPALASIDLLWQFLAWLAGFKFSVASLPAPSPGSLLMALAGSAILLLPRGFPARWLGALWFLPLLLAAPDRPLHGAFRFTLLDVGQGLAGVVETRSHVLLYDTGPRFGPEFDAGRAVILPFFRHRGIRRVDLLVQSEGDIDHIGGLASVLAQVPVVRVLSSVPDRVPLPTVDVCRTGQRWNWDGVEFSILHPPEPDRFRGNDAACVLRVSAGGRSLLLSGDIERRAEYRLVAHQSADLRAALLVAPHHGSRTSSTPVFITAVQPDVVLIAAGFRNRYGLPNQDIIARYRQAGARILDTARHGAIEVHVNDAGISILTYRQAARRFWHSSP